MSTPMSCPVLLLLFNRPDLAEQVFGRIREFQPTELFIAVDGPRESREGEERLVRENQALTEKVDWNCEVKTLFRSENLGCGRAVSDAINWFFESVDRGVILEDDCLVDPTFFGFASELLDFYADEEKIMMINGSTFAGDDNMQSLEESYYFSVFGFVWGWATWKRAWERYDFGISSWPESEAVRSRLSELDLLPRLHRKYLFDRVKEGRIDTWDFQWEHAIWEAGGLVVSPSVNMVQNIGFDDRATHTRDGNDERVGCKGMSMNFPLVHPLVVKRNCELDKSYEQRQLVNFPRLFKALLSRLKRAVAGGHG